VPENSPDPGRNVGNERAKTVVHLRKNDFFEKVPHWGLLGISMRRGMLGRASLKNRKFQPEMKGREPNEFKKRGLTKGGRRSKNNHREVLAKTADDRQWGRGKRRRG